MMFYGNNYYACDGNRWRLRVGARVCSSIAPRFAGLHQHPQQPPRSHPLGTVPNPWRGQPQPTTWVPVVIPTGLHLQSLTHTGDTCTVEYSRAWRVRPAVPLSLCPSAAAPSPRCVGGEPERDPRGCWEHRMLVARWAWGQTGGSWTRAGALIGSGMRGCAWGGGKSCRS